MKAVRWVAPASLALLLVGCGQVAAQSSPVEPVPTDGVELPDVEEVSLPTDSVPPEEAIDDATVYLPTYGGGAEPLEDLDGIDRGVEAEESLALWKEVEAKSDGEDGLGEASAEASLEAIQEDLDLSDEEFAELQEEADADVEAKGAIPPTDEEIADGFFVPVFTELATVCGAPSAVSLFAADNIESPSVLEQYGDVAVVDSAGLPAGLLAAWQVATPGAETFAYITAETPEILIVTAVAAGSCPLAQVTEQVRVAREGVDQ